MTVEWSAQAAGLIEASPDAIVGVDAARTIVLVNAQASVGKTLDGIITSWNPGAERLYGYPAATMLGRRIDVLYTPERAWEEDRLLARIADGEQVEQHLTERVRGDGRTITVSLAVSPIRDSSGAIVGAASVSRDAFPHKAPSTRRSRWSRSRSPKPNSSSRSTRRSQPGHSLGWRTRGQATA
ncbi:PAS domain S-box protein [Dactylosporangium sp. NPDC051485]|uniref:PAS domain-containing protein n=1 Tax=Dactylosporangium sp. NPDC051485 TaxID=3154846 RepID=UPI00341E00BA